MQGRIRAGSLRIIKDACPNLIAEAGLYRYDEVHHEKSAENPIGEYDHALDALRYLIVSLDQRRLALPTAGRRIRRWFMAQLRRRRPRNHGCASIIKHCGKIAISNKQ